MPRKAGGSVQGGVRKWEVRQDGRTEGLPGRRGMEAGHPDVT